MTYKKIVIILCLSLGVLLVAFCKERSDEGKFRQNLANSESISIGGLVEIYLELKNSQPLDGQSQTKKIQQAIQEQALIFLGTDFLLQDMTSDGFKGVCLLVSRRSELFPISPDTTSASILVNRALSNRLLQMEEEVREENANRGARTWGENQSCPGFDRDKFGPSVK